MKSYPALDVADVDGELVLAVADDYSPAAVEESAGFLTIFFPEATLRDNARVAIVRAFPSAQVTTRDVDDDDWARRSQESLGPVTVGRVTVAPPWSRHLCSNVTVIIQPSMGFGTGHHATTRLCLAALQTLDLADAIALDAGAGSGVLALAARALGAREALGIDNDPDAVACARDNLALNPALDRVRFEVIDLSIQPFQGREPGRDQWAADVITANLTGTLLCRAAPALMAALAPGGALVVSGLLAGERADVAAAFHDLTLVREQEEDGWLGLVFEDRRERQLEPSH